MPDVLDAPAFELLPCRFENGEIILCTEDRKATNYVIVFDRDVRKRIVYSDHERALRGYKALQELPPECVRSMAARSQEAERRFLVQSGGRQE